MKKLIQELFWYTFPFLVCAGMFIIWLFYGYSDKGKVISLCVLIAGYLAYEHKERKEFREWKRKRLKH